MSELNTKVVDIIVDKLSCKREEVKLESSFEELGADSLDAVEIIMAFEEEFGVEIPDEKAEGMKTIKDIVEFLDQNK